MTLDRWKFSQNVLFPTEVLISKTASTPKSPIAMEENSSKSTIY